VRFYFEAVGNVRGRSLQNVQGHRVAQGHMAGFAVDVTPRTGGPVGRMLSIRWPCVTHSARRAVKEIVKRPSEQFSKRP